MPIDWGYFTIVFVFLCATIAYGFRDGGDPWVAAGNICFLILAGKGIVWLYLQLTS